MICSFPVYLLCLCGKALLKMHSSCDSGVVGRTQTEHAVAPSTCWNSVASMRRQIAEIVHIRRPKTTALDLQAPGVAEPRRTERSQVEKGRGDGWGVAAAVFFGIQSLSRSAAFSLADENDRCGFTRAREHGEFECNLEQLFPKVFPAQHQNPGCWEIWWKPSRERTPSMQPLHQLLHDQASDGAPNHTKKSSFPYLQNTSIRGWIFPSGKSEPKWVHLFLAPYW